MCTAEDIKAMMAIALNPQLALECLKACTGVPVLPCTNKCFHKVLDGKLTPKCSQCNDQAVSCGMAKCDDCHGADSLLACGMCMVQRCHKEALACAPMHKKKAPMLHF